jgi:hypothetical protein
MQVIIEEIAHNAGDESTQMQVVKGPNSNFIIFKIVCATVNDYQ